MKFFKKTLFFWLILPLSAGIWGYELGRISAGQDEAAVEDGDLSIHTASFKVFIEPSVSWGRVYRKISRRRIYFGARNRPDASLSDKDKVAYRVNLIFERVKELLGMYPQGVTFQVKIFKGQSSVDDAWHRFSRSTKPSVHVKAFYVHGLRTVFTSEEGLADSVLAHEFGHVLQNYYFVALPSSKVTEMLSIYVDENLEE